MEKRGGLTPLPYESDLCGQSVYTHKAYATALNARVTLGRE